MQIYLENTEATNINYHIRKQYNRVFIEIMAWLSIIEIHITLISLLNKHFDIENSITSGALWTGLK